MKNKLLTSLLLKLEIASVIFLLFFAETVVVPDAVRTLTNILSYGIVILLVSVQWQRIAYVATTDKTLMLLTIIGVFSVFWSYSLGDTVEQVRALVRSTIFGLYLASRYTPREQINLLSWVGIISIFLCTIVSFAAPSVGTHVVNGVVSWRGIYAHKQHMGRFMGFLASIFLINILDKRCNRWFAFILLLVSLILLVLSNSKTGLIVFLYPVFAFPIYIIVKQRKNRFFILLLAVLIFTIISALILVNLESIVVNYLGKDIEFNGRIPLWVSTIQEGLKRPFLGYGYNAFWTSDASYDVIRNTWLRYEDIDPDSPFQAHNGFIDLFVQLGFLGLSLFVFHLLTVIYRVVNILFMTRKIETFWMFMFLGINVLVNTSEVITFMSTNSVFWIIYVSIAFSSAVEYKQIKRVQLISSLNQA
ncbi:O-antigen polymerase [Fischerella thermalis CCMEE 5208]|uniref:O-antigen ligase family protein n=1 Tax=Fischerella thermalis TaxID=372787 RepID=UPI000C8102F9|nr:O-antigen ligase family protein [Fischerella thermalis]PMB33223.1 O-antigen polymerase [Fischerella thermalis CCMEE 5208]